MNRVGLSSISFQLGSLDYNSAMILFKELTFSDNNDKLFSAKYTSDYFLLTFLIWSEIHQ